jgi:hypothetical protein
MENMHGGKYHRREIILGLDSEARKMNKGTAAMGFQYIYIRVADCETA